MSLSGYEVGTQFELNGKKYVVAKIVEGKDYFAKELAADGKGKRGRPKKFGVSQLPRLNVENTNSATSTIPFVANVVHVETPLEPPTVSENSVVDEFVAK